MNDLRDSRSRTGATTSVSAIGECAPGCPDHATDSRLSDSLWRGILVLGNIIFFMMEASRVEQ